MIIEELDDRSLSVLMLKLSPERQIKIINSIVGKVNQDILNRLRELQENPPQGICSIEVIQEFISVEVRSMATPGYNIKSSPKRKSGNKIEKKEAPDSINKQEAIQNVLRDHFEVNEEEIIILTEAETQRDLSHKYTAYYAQIQGTGILIVLNNEYGQAARVKKVENQEDAQTQLYELIEILEDVDKRTMDVVHGFQAFYNTYSSQQALEELYIEKITDHLQYFEVVNLNQSAISLWNSIKFPTHITCKGRQYGLEKIQDFLDLSFSFYSG